MKTITALAWAAVALIAIAPKGSHALCQTDSTVAEFTAGSGCYVGDDAGGEVLLPATLATEFSGVALPAGWTTNQWVPPDGSVSVSGGTVTVLGYDVYPDPAAYSSGSLEFVATFAIASMSPLKAQVSQTIGFGSGSIPFNATPLLAIGTYNQSGVAEGKINALVWDTGVNTPIPLHTVDGLPHRYRIDWQASTVSYSVDGVLITTQPQSVGVSMRPAISNFLTDNPLVVDWMHLTPYTTPCAYESALIDSGAPATDWSTQSETIQTPAGTGFTVSTRTGPTATIDGSWSSYQVVSGGVIASPRNRFLQYKVDLTTTNVDQTPELADVTVCYAPCTPTAEICDGLDNNCNDVIDEGDPGGGGACNTGNPGICAAGIDHCVSGAIQCVQTNSPQAETCNGLDDNCNGSTDEGDPGGGGACNTGTPGICAAGVDHCVSGAIQCVQTNSPQAETCNGLDDNCNGSTDEGDPGGGGACNTGNPGICAAGIDHCVSGGIQCVQTNTPQAETCNNLDDNCNGSTDEGNPGGGAGCDTGQEGVCGPGTITCISGSLNCQPNLAATPEICNGLDDNCVNGIDEGNPGGGASCSTGLQGVCAAGTTQCQSPTLVCVQNVMASTEICDTMADENCDGSVDESPCDLCTAANTVSATAQTKVSVVKLSADKGKLVTKGTFVLPMAGMIDPVASPVTVRLEDNTGVAYQATIPASSFTGNSSHRSFKFSDTSSPFENGGLQRAKIKISGGDDVTTKYLFKARELDLQTFTAGTGKVTVRIGDRCFRDTADACTLSPSGTKAKCK